MIMSIVTKQRWALVICVAAAVLFTGVLFGQQSKRRSSRVRSANTTARLQGIVEKRFLQLQAKMGELLRVLAETDSGAGDAERGDRLLKALRRSNELQLVARLREVRKLLVGSRLEEALLEETAVERDLERILRILRGEDEDLELKKKQEELRDLREGLQRLERLTKKQEEELKRTQEEREGGNQEAQNKDDANKKAEEKKGLAKKRAAEQQELRRKTERLRRQLERQTQRRSGGRQGGESGDRQNSQAGRQSDQQSGAESGRQGQSNRSNRRNRSARERQSLERRRQAAQSMRRAEGRMQGASGRLESGNEQGAAKDQEEALEQLRSAQEQLQQELRDEEAEQQRRIARRVAARLHAMLAEQELISTETRQLGADLSDVPVDSEGEREKQDETVAVPEKRESEEEALEPEPESEPESRSSLIQRATRILAERERHLKKDAEDIRTILGEDGTTVAAPVIIAGVAEDLELIASLLESRELGTTVELMQGDVESTLRELIAVFEEKARQRGGAGSGGSPGGNGGGGGGGSGGGGGQEQQKRLLPPVAEIKMLLSNQRQLRRRTERLATPDNADPPEKRDRVGESRRRELLDSGTRRLSTNQKALADLTDDVRERYPFIDEFLSGRDNEDAADHEDGDHEEQDGAAKEKVKIKRETDGGETDSPPEKTESSKPLEQDG